MNQTFKQYLIEDSQSPEQVAQIILNKCLPFVNALGDVEPDTVLYRGSDAKITDFQTRERHSSGGVTGNYSGELGKLLDNFFNSKCGITLDTIIFATGDPAIAKTFGNPYVIFPVGAFKFAYSQAGIPLPMIENEEDLKRANFQCGVCDDMSEDGYTDPDFQRAIRSNSEVLIYAKGYLPISLAYWNQNSQAILENLSFR